MTLTPYQSFEGRSGSPGSVDDQPLLKMEAEDGVFEGRRRALERLLAEKAGEERRVSTVSAGAGGVVAVLVRVLGGG